jgi:hypothetical protein
MPDVKQWLKLHKMRTGQKAYVARSQEADNSSATLENSSRGYQNTATGKEGESSSVNNPVPDIDNDDPEKIRIHVPRKIGRLERWLTRTKFFWKPPLTPMEQDLLDQKRHNARIFRSLEINMRRANHLLPNAFAHVNIEYVRSRTKDKYENSKPQRVHFGKWLASSDGNTIYGKVDHTPHGKLSSELVKPEVLTELALAVGHPVGGRIDENGGGVIISVALAGTNDIDDMFSFNKALELLSPSAPPLTYMVGATINGGRKFYDLEQMPHLLIAGSTGSGKSVAMLGIIGTFAARNMPETVQLLLADFKGVDFNHFEGLPHLIHTIPEIPSGIVDKDSQIMPMLNWVVMENKRRQDMFAKHKVHNLMEWNSHHHIDKLSRIVIFIDEIARLNQNKKIKDEFNIVTYDVASTSRATGIHLVFSTQFPKDEFITTAIKMNFPGRMAFSVPDVHGSICMIETGEATNIYPPPGRGIFVHGVTRFKFQSPFISDNQIKEIIHNARAGKTTVSMAKSTELSPEEVVTWSLTEANGFLNSREVFRAFTGRMPWEQMAAMLKEMDNKNYPFGDALYKVIPPASQLARRLEKVIIENNLPADAAERHDVPPEPEPEPLPAAINCPNCGAERHFNPCEWCGVM